MGPGAKQCLEIITRRTGQEFTSTNAAAVALLNCDQVFLAATAINNAGSAINLGSARKALEGLGSGFASAFVPKAFFSASRHDGLQRGFDLAWDSACECARYRDNGHAIK